MRACGVAYGAALPSEDELRQRGARHPLEFFEKLEAAEGPDAVEAFRATRHCPITEPLPPGQPIEQKLTQFIEWLIRSVQGPTEGAADGPPRLSARDVETFRSRRAR